MLTTLNIFDFNLDSHSTNHIFTMFLRIIVHFLICIYHMLYHIIFKINISTYQICVISMNHSECRFVFLLERAYRGKFEESNLVDIIIFLLVSTVLYTLSFTNYISFKTSKAMCLSSLARSSSRLISLSLFMFVNISSFMYI